MSWTTYITRLHPLAGEKQSLNFDFMAALDLGAAGVWLLAVLASDSLVAALCFKLEALGIIGDVASYQGDAQFLGWI